MLSPIVEGMRGAVLAPRGCSAARHGGQEVSITPITLCLGGDGAVESLCPARTVQRAQLQMAGYPEQRGRPGRTLLSAVTLTSPVEAARRCPDFLSAGRSTLPADKLPPWRCLLAFSLLF